MTKQERIVYDAVERIIRKRKEAHRVPHCALRREVMAELDASKADIAGHDLTAVLQKLVDDGRLVTHPTQNDQSYYLTERK